jgi:hypothetical protein
LTAVAERTTFKVEADAAAQAWLDSHPCSGPRRLDYEVKLCCGGGRIRSVSIRTPKAGQGRGDHVAGALADGGQLFIDRRAAARLPSSFGLTVRGFGPLRHLDLDLSPEQWGALLYD